MPTKQWPLTLTERFWSKVLVTGAGACHIWQGARNDVDYGQIRIHGKTFYAHRLAWMIVHRRRIPKGLYVLHKCDRPPCVNVRHLYVGTQSDNLRDVYKRRWKARAMPWLKPYQFRNGYDPRRGF